MTIPATVLRSLPLITLIGWAVAQAPEARAASPAQCTKYATSAVAQYNQYRAQRCGPAGGRWHANYSVHYKWCRGVPALFLNIETGRRNTDLAQCAKRTRARPPGRRPGAPPGGLQTRKQFCTQYARRAIAQNEDRLSRGCRRYGGHWSSSYGKHYGWCLKAPRGQPESLNRERQARLRECFSKKSCTAYAKAAVHQNNENRKKRCGYREGGRWSSNYNHHYTWCARGQDRAAVARERRIRDSALLRCGGNRALNGSFRIVSVVPVFDRNTGYVSTVRINVEANSATPWSIGSYGGHMFGNLWAEVTAITKNRLRTRSGPKGNRIQTRVRKYQFSIRRTGGRTSAFLSPRPGAQVPAGRRMIPLVVSPFPRIRLTGVRFRLKKGAQGCWYHRPEIRVKVFFQTHARKAFVGRSATTGKIRNAYFETIDLSGQTGFNTGVVSEACN
jgi:hypothetical protein